MLNPIRLLRTLLLGGPNVVGVADQIGKEGEKGLRRMFVLWGWAVLILAACVGLSLLIFIIGIVKWLF